MVCRKRGSSAATSRMTTRQSVELGNAQPRVHMPTNGRGRTRVGASASCTPLMFMDNIVRHPS